MYGEGSVHPRVYQELREGFGEIFANINLSIDDLSHDPPKWRDGVPLFRLMETAKSYIAKHTPIARLKNTTLPRYHNNNSNSTVTSQTKTTDKLKGQESNLPRILIRWKLGRDISRKP